MRDRKNSGHIRLRYFADLGHETHLLVWELPGADLNPWYGEIVEEVEGGARILHQIMISDKNPVCVIEGIHSLVTQTFNDSAKKVKELAPLLGRISSINMEVLNQKDQP